MPRALFIAVPIDDGFCGALRAYRGTRTQAEEYFADKIVGQPGSEVLQLADGCLLGPELKEAESGGGSATGSGQPETCCGEAPAVDRKALFLPCPFCGSPPFFEKHSGGLIVRCTSERGACPARCGSWWETEERALEVWNRRAISAGGDAMD